MSHNYNDRFDNRKYVVMGKAIQKAMNDCGDLYQPYLDLMVKLQDYAMWLTAEKKDQPMFTFAECQAIHNAYSKVQSFLDNFRYVYVIE